MIDGAPPRLHGTLGGSVSGVEGEGNRQRLFAVGARPDSPCPGGKNKCHGESNPERARQTLRQ
jgi:hypothetical protein